MAMHLSGALSITESFDDFSYDIGGGAVAVALTLHTHYLDLFALMDAVAALIPNGVWSMGSDGYVTLGVSSGTVAITWTDTALRDWIGFTGNLTAGASHTATTPPQYYMLTDLVEGWEAFRGHVGLTMQAVSEGGHVHVFSKSETPRLEGPIAFWASYDAADGPGSITQLIQFWRYAGKGVPFTITDHAQIGNGAWSTSLRTGWLALVVSPRERGDWEPEWFGGVEHQHEVIFRKRVIAGFDTSDYEVQT